ncbi:polysaccharide deacetylase family protein [Halalkalicoccus sp. NIPERK01]|uniref:polysaccharide deacetylase family protein n=1 Tax=Halalkalicoccus sp. NIPERK01 TaxID=3053469 RepID=UPI00256EABCC|nr:polysaccharide deacetylase family protein [Halalkalicoccus sp. NIPERK01]MDL5361206.1 polysaccharide deacetylase family protein [Halalkalicoccus sp. NIPERK01]
MDRDTRDAIAGGFANVVSFDLEHWYTATLLRDEVTDPVDRIETSVGIVLDVLDEHDTTATFFVVGEVAHEYPELIGRVADAGHEIASHGHTHTPLFELTPGAFAGELDASADAIEAAIGERPAGFRAPNFSVTTRTQWAFDALIDAGYRYDSSVFPVETPMYGVSGAPVGPYWVDRDRPFTDTPPGDADGLLELPLAMFHPRIRIPTAGGFYGRLLPTWLLSRGIRNLNRRGIPATIYFHPWEFNPEVRVDGVPAHKRFVSFYGLDRAREKLSTLLSTHEFTTCERVVETYDR